MSTLTYNGRTIQICKTVGIAQEPQYEDGGTDYEYTKNTFHVTGLVAYVSPGLGGPLGPGLITDGASAAYIAAAIRHDFLVPRKPFYFIVNGSTYMQVPSGLDVKNGPKPISCNVTAIHGDQVFYVDYTIEVYSKECSTALNFLTHRWEDSVSIDQDKRTTATRSGRITCRSDILANADQLRGIVSLPVPQGFVRTKADYKLSRDGLVLQYTFVDHEVDCQPPTLAGATQAEGQFLESCTTPHGVGNRSGEVRVKLKAGADGQTDVLIQQALRIAIMRLGGELAGPTDDLTKTGKPMLKGFSVEESLYTNEVNCTLKFLRAQPKARKGGVPITDLEQWGVFPDGSDGVGPPELGDRGTASLNLIAAALQDPCLTTLNQNNRTQGTNEPYLVDLMAPPPKFSLGNLLPEDTTSYDDTAGFWEDFQVSTVYDIDGHAVQIPVAPKDSSGGTGNDPLLNGGTSAIFKMSEPTMVKTICWTCETLAGKMSIPNYNAPQNANLVLKSARVLPEQLTLSADGKTFGMRCSGTYVYLVKDHRLERLEPAIAPWMFTTGGSDAESVVELVDGIINHGRGIALPEPLAPT